MVRNSTVLSNGILICNAALILTPVKARIAESARLSCWNQRITHMLYFMVSTLIIKIMNVLRTDRFVPTYCARIQGNCIRPESHCISLLSSRDWGRMLPLVPSLSLGKQRNLTPNGLWSIDSSSLWLERHLAGLKLTFFSVGMHEADTFKVWSVRRSLHDILNERDIAGWLRQHNHVGRGSELIMLVQ